MRRERKSKAFLAARVLLAYIIRALLRMTIGRIDSNAIGTPPTCNANRAVLLLGLLGCRSLRTRLRRLVPARMKALQPMLDSTVEQTPLYVD